jgi:hypothetical protein
MLGLRGKNSKCESKENLKQFKNVELGKIVEININLISPKVKIKSSLKLGKIQ